jgi:hypothetical protein
MSNKTIYYVYAYLREDGTPYYIGKGKGLRMHADHRHIGLPPKNRRIILENNLSEVGALAIERRLIRWWGRKDIGTGILRNMTDGGDGSSGIKRTAEHTAKIAAANRGRKNTQETKQKMSAAKMGKKMQPFSEEHKAKLSAANSGKKLSEEHKAKLSESHKGQISPRKGKTHSEESKAKMSESLKGRVSPNKGKTLPPLSEEHKAKLRGPRGPQKNKSF